MGPKEREIRRRLRVLEHAEKIGNVRMTCRYFGLSRSTFYRWKTKYDKYGKEAIERVFEDRPGEYLRIIASLVPKELALEISDTKWVINASPRLTESEWRLQHGLDSLENEQDKIGCGE
jgi:transposase-like protein